jgi:hypothetical protein
VKTEHVQTLSILEEFLYLGTSLGCPDAEEEKEFWQWTQRPAIQQNSIPYRDKDKMRREVERMLNRRLLGIGDPDELPDEHADPAMLI